VLNPNDLTNTLRTANVHPQDALATLTQLDQRATTPGQTTNASNTNAHTLRDVFSSNVFNRLTDPNVNPAQRQQTIQQTMQHTDAATLGNLVAQMQHRLQNSGAVSPAFAEHLNGLIDLFSRRQMELINSDTNNPTNAIALRNRLGNRSEFDNLGNINALKPENRAAYSQLFNRYRTTLPNQGWQNINYQSPEQQRRQELLRQPTPWYMHAPQMLMNMVPRY
jgi:hypothetical protein